jgi:SAM-dependent methyltransferase
MVLLTPALRVKLYVPFAVPLLRLWNSIRGRTFIRSYVSGRMLTHDAVEAQRYDRDPLISRQIAVNILLELQDTSRRLIADAGAITVSTLVLAAGSDRVVRVSAQRRFFDRLSSPLKRFEMFDGAFHDLIHETDADAVVTRIRDFLKELFDRPQRDARVCVERAIAHTEREYRRLAAPLPWLHPRRWRLATAKAVLRTAGRLSDGIRLGWRTGFDSGASLDYVYRNVARGITPLGSWIDRRYLNSPGWRGIRLHRENLQRLSRRSFQDLHRAGRPIRVLDIAAGAGRYLIETLAATNVAGASGLLRDNNPENLEAAGRLAQNLGVPNLELECADAFDPRCYESISPRVTVAVVSGLYELIPENEPIRLSLLGLANALEPGGYLIYTNQPWHPQIELIARTLINREGRPWLMRRRTQAEIDERVRAAGFDKLAQEIDPWGIFTVSLARRAGG